MSYPEDPDYTGKAPKHRETSLEIHRKNLSEMSRTSIKPSSKEYEIDVQRIKTSFKFSYGTSSVTTSTGYVIQHRSEDVSLFNKILLDIKEISGRKYIKSHKSWYVPLESQEELLKFLEKYSVPPPTEIETKTKFNVGDIVIAIWGKEYSGKAKVIDTSYVLADKSIKYYRVELLEDSEDYKIGMTIFIPLEDTLSYGEFSRLISIPEAESKHPSFDFKPDDIVEAHWSVEGSPRTIIAKIKHISALSYTIEILENKSYPLYSYSTGATLYINVKFTSTEYLKPAHEIFKDGDTVTAHIKFVTGGFAHVKSIIKNISSKHIKIEFIEDGLPHVKKGSTWGIRIPFSDLEYLTPSEHESDYPPFSVGEIVILHTNMGKPIVTKAKIVEIGKPSPKSKEFAIKSIPLEPIEGSGSSLIHYPFSGEYFLEKLPPSFEYSDFPIGTIVQAHWKYGSEKLIAKAKISKADGSPYGSSKLIEITLLEAAIPHYKKGDHINFGFPFIFDYYLEKLVTSRTPFNLSDFNKKLFKKYKEGK